MRVIKITFLFLVTLSFVACAPGLGNTLRVDRFDNLEQQKLPQLRTVNTLKLGHFIDARSEREIGEIDGRPLMPGTDVAISVKEAFREALEEAGALGTSGRAGSSETIIVGTIKDWKININPGWPSTQALATARLDLEFLDSQRRPLFSGRYNGTVEAEYPLLSEERIETLLASAMQYAINEALNDQQLQAQIGAGGAF